MAPSSLLLTVVLLAALAGTVVNSTRVKNCKGQRHGKMLAVNISACEEAPCILKKNTAVSIDINFVPMQDVTYLRNRVFARLVGLPLPFIGVDGKSSCTNVYMPDGTNAGCPLRAGTEYVYKNKFDVLPIYPTINPVVHWALQDGANSNDVVCFEIQTRIQQA